MLFNSFPFLFAYLPVVLAGHWWLKHHRWPMSAQALLLVASFSFYAWNRPSSLVFLCVSILFNFALARFMTGIADRKQKVRVLRLGLAGNLLFLGILKYSRFAQATLASLTGIHLPVPQLALPLGVSFFTIQQIMYLVDSFEGLCPANSLFDHASFVAFFPYLTSGPLARCKQMVPQLRDEHPTSAEAFGRGLALLGFGLFKKVVIADCIGRFVEAGFTHLGNVSVLEAWISCTVYCLQIYFDFSGYSDMALGIAGMLGFTLPPNFNAPYQATSIIEFWQRWHISLSKFITTYLYTPLVRAMGKATLVTASLATLGAMALAGLWHGPAWTYVIFGCIHGLALVVNQLWRKKIKIPIPAAIAWPLTMGAVFIGFVFFRSPNLASALSMLHALFLNPDWLGRTAFKSVIRMSDLTVLGLPMLLALPLALFGPDSNELTRRLTPGVGVALGLVVIFLTSFLFLNSTIAQDFVYFAF